MDNTEKQTDENIQWGDCGVKDPNIICRQPWCLSCKDKVRKQPLSELASNEVKENTNITEPLKEDTQEEIEESEEELTIKRERFCILYASDSEFFANGVQSYIEAFSSEGHHVNYNSAKVRASELLTNRNILKRINEILELRGLNDPFVDKQLEFIITQNADLSTKLNGIREYNRLKSRIEEKIKHSFDNSNVLSPEQLNEILTRKKQNGNDISPKTE